MSFVIRSLRQVRKVLEVEVRRVIVLASTIGVGVCVSGCSNEIFSEAAERPELQATSVGATATLWVWDQTHDLSFLDPSRHRAAIYAGSVWLHGEDVVVEPRHHSVVMPNSLPRITVVRIEVSKEQSPALSSAQVDDVSSAVLSLARLTPGESVQLDFDATRSQRPFYTRLLQRLHAALPSETTLSIAALASWCLDDPWVDGLPIEEAVPMLYRMGPESSAIRATLDRGDDFTSPVCRKSIGVSTDEPIPTIPPDRHVFAFHDRPWSAEALEQVAEATQRDI